MASASKKRNVLGTENYVLYTQIKFGRGSMAEVVLARHRKKGHPFAAKIFSDETRRYHMKYIQREIELLRNIPKHENIVQLIELVKEKVKGFDVLIMELCQGGNLQEILNERENYFGLPEEEFLLVFEHTVCALKHIHGHGILHRDVKPGNILRHITDGGRFVYKLADFSVSCYAENGYSTICGTEQYLHPSMYEAAFTISSPRVHLSKSMDLWSLAITLYQCATGKFPYCPYKGIQCSKSTTLKLMKEKEAGVISQIEKKDGSIQSSKELPRTTKLLQGTQQLVTEVLAKLMDTENVCDPDSFYRDMEELFSKKKLRIFSSDLSDLFTVFIPENARFVQLEEEITATLTKIKPSSEQKVVKPLLLIGDQQSVKHSKDIKDYIAASDGNGHIYMMSSSDGPPKQHLLKSSSGDSTETLTTEALLGQIMYFPFLIRRCSEIQQLSVSLFCALRSYLEKEFSEVQATMSQASSLAKTVQIFSCDITDMYSKNKSRFNCLNSKMESYKSLPAEMISCKDNRCVQRVTVNSQEALRTYDCLTEAGKQPETSRTDEELLQYCKHQMKKILKEQNKLFQTHCQTTTREVCEKTHKRVRELLQCLQRNRTLKSDLKCLVKLYEDTIKEYLTSVGVAHLNGMKR